MDNIKSALLTLRILFFAILMGMVIPAAVGSYLVYTGEPVLNEALKEIFQFVIPLVAISCGLASQLVFKKMLFHLDASASLQQKMDTFRSAFILRCALLEAPVLLAVIALFLTGDVINLVVFSVILVVYCLHYPSTDKIIDALPLNDEEIRMIRDDQ